MLMKSLMDSPSLSKPLPRLRLQSELFENPAAQLCKPSPPEPLADAVYSLPGGSLFFPVHAS